MHGIAVASIVRRGRAPIMKTLIVTLLVLPLALGPMAAVAIAQTGGSAATEAKPSNSPGAPGAQPTTPSAGDRSTDTPAAPSADRPGAASSSDSTSGSSTPSKPDVNVNVKPDRSDDGAAASPRTSPSDTRIFGLSPMVAVAIAAALLIVVILAIVSMSRTGPADRIDIDRRL
jgi:hypothetical protein